MRHSQLVYIIIRFKHLSFVLVLLSQTRTLDSGHSLM